MRFGLLFVLSVLTFTSYSKESDVTSFNAPPDSTVKAEGFKNSLKINLPELFLGDFALYYERALSPKVTMEIGAGATVASPFVGLIDDFYQDAYYFNHSGIPSKVRFSAAAGIRYYFSRPFEKWYIAPEFKYRYIQRGARTKTNMSFRLAAGYTHFFGDHFFMDWGLGIGFSIRGYVDDSPYSMGEDDGFLMPHFNPVFKLGFSF